MTVAKSKRPEAERAAVHVLYELFGCKSHMRAVRTKFQRQDLHACDVEGVPPDGSGRVWAQVTAGQTAAVLTRRKKIERETWTVLDRVFVWQLVERVDVSNPRRKDWFFRVWEYTYGLKAGPDGHAVRFRHWTDAREPIPIKREWFKARKEAGE